MSRDPKEPHHMPGRDIIKRHLALIKAVLRGEMNFYPLFPPFVAIWEKFGVREPDIMILNFCEYRESRQWQGCT
jgi:hypothetical protein